MIGPSKIVQYQPFALVSDIIQVMMLMHNGEMLCPLLDMSSMKNYSTQLCMKGSELEI